MCDCIGPIADNCHEFSDLYNTFVIVVDGAQRQICDGCIARDLEYTLKRETNDKPSYPMYFKLNEQLPTHVEFISSKEKIVSSYNQRTSHTTKRAL